MISVSHLLGKIQVEFNCKKTTFYKRKSELESLGYKLEPQKQGRVSFYSDEQFIFKLGLAGRDLETGFLIEGH